MSCPDWQDLSRRRDAEQLDDARWREALDHMDSCPKCRDEAVAADPTLLFRRLPTLTADDSQVRAMQQAVAGMRHGAAALDRRRLPPSSWLRATAAASWLRAAAVAAVLLGASLLNGTAPRSPEVVSIADAVAEAEGYEIYQAGDNPLYELAPVGVAPVAFETHASALPLVEMADPSFGSIIEVVDQDITLVVVMSEDRGV